MTARPLAVTPPRAARITILDILRALALLGIVIVHAHDHFNLYLPVPPAEGWQAAANSMADWAYEHLFVSKSFLLFSFLFGLSFFIQLDRQEQKGIDFRKRFMWRLALLFLLGLAHTLFYDGDILTIFGILGFALVALYRCRTALLVILCLLCLLQPVAFMDTLSRAGMADIWPHSSGWFQLASPAAGPSREFLYAQGSWGEAALWNLTRGQTGKWQFFLLSGRLWQTLGLFILGMLAGRWRIFENASNKRRLFLRMLEISGTLFLALLAVRLLLSSRLGFPLGADAGNLLHQWENLAYTAAFVSAAVLLFTHPGIPLPVRLLSSAGKCTLTCYVTQTLIFTFLFFGWGLGLAQAMGPWTCLCTAVAVFLLQAWACRLWLDHFLYGPLEWLWRTATMCRMQPFRRCTPEESLPFFHLPPR